MADLVTQGASAEIVTARKVTQRTAQAAPVTHYRSNSINKSNSNNTGLNSPKPDMHLHDVCASPRILPSPVPPPVTALPPTPGSRPLSYNSTRSPSLPAAAAASFGAAAAPITTSLSSRQSISRRTFRQLTSEQRQELVRKILTDLSRPAPTTSTTTTTTTVRPFTRTPKMAGGSKRFSSASASTVGSDCSDEKLGSDYSTPQLSQSRTMTPTTPCSPAGTTGLSSNANSDEEVKETDKHKVGALLSPSAALESLRSIENTFDRSHPSSPTTATVTANADPVPQTPKLHKRDSSYRKPLPKLLDHHCLPADPHKGLGIAASPSTSSASETASCSSRSTSVEPQNSSSTSSSISTWISSLSTLEAIRVLALQHTIADASSAQSCESDEVAALRYALSFALVRADKLAEALTRATEEKAKSQRELEILRTNVLGMLGSRSMFDSPAAQQQPQQGERSVVIEQKVVEQVEEDKFVDARTERPASRQAEHRVERKPSGASSGVSRPPRAGRKTPAAAAAAATLTATTPAVATAIVAAAAPTKPTGGVSIASLRKNAAATVAPAAQRYTPSNASQSVDIQAASTSASDDDEDEDSFDMYPYGGPPPKRLVPEVSMTDFLNASRMSKTEILEHDARRELERSVSDDMDTFSTASSATPLYTSGTLRSLETHRRGFFKNITRLVDEGRAKTGMVGRRTSLVSKASVGAPAMMERSPSMRSGSSARDRETLGGPRDHFTMTYREESIIPPYPGQNNGSSDDFARAPSARNKTMSLNNSLRESVERQSLWELQKGSAAATASTRRWREETFGAPLI